MKRPYCGKRMDEEPAKATEPTVADLAINDIEMAEDGFQFNEGELDWYFEGGYENTVPYFYLLLPKLKRIKEDQGV